MRELATIQDQLGRAGNYAALQFSTDTADPARGALLQKVQERATQLETRLLFFELEWAALDDARAEELLAADGLDFARHYLRSARRYRPHLLTEPEEKVLTEKALTGRSAWGRLFEELVSALQVDLGGGEDVPLDSALSQLLSPDRDVRRNAAEAVTATLEPGLRTRAYVYNTLMADKATDDRLRHYPNWISSRNLANEASDESVQALIDAVQRRYELPRRWYRLKAKLLGLDRLADYDRMAARHRATRRWCAGRTARRSCSAPTRPSRPSWAASRVASSTPRGSTRRRGRPSARARSAPTRCRRCTRTCCSTTRTGAATCSSSPTSSATASTPPWPRRRGSSTRARR